ncbi:MAG: CsiV family protein [Pseudomonadota bacterium]
MKRIATLLLALALPMTASAERLRVDVLIFTTARASPYTGTPPRHPDDDRAIAIDDLRGLAQAGIALLPEASTTLAAEWATLTLSKVYKPVLRLSWLQEGAVFEGGPALRIYLPGGDGISGLDGWLRLNRGRSVQLSADLELVQVGADQLPQAHRLRERRELPLDTLHYLDSNRIGVLARVSAAR